MNKHETLVVGGSFNPPTKAHQALVEACLGYDPTTEVWLLPSGERMDKNIATDPTERFNLLSLMAQDISNDRLSICTLEIKNTEYTQTYKTVGKLAAKYPDNNFRYVFGADSYMSMPTWENGGELQRQLPILVVPRGGIIVPKAPNVEILDNLAVEDGVSSTVVREALAKGQNVAQFCCAGVANYIEQRKMYAATLT